MLYFYSNDDTHVAHGFQMLQVHKESIGQKQVL